MKLNPKRGINYGLGNGILAALVFVLNKAIRHEAIELDEVATFAIFATFFFGLIWTLTDKFGSDVGD